MENSVAMPRFVFLHRINISSVEVEKIPTYLDGIRSKLGGVDKLPMLEYFVPVREGPDYSLTILDLNGLGNVVI